jgi:hypothetical protein
MGAIADSTMDRPQVGAGRRSVVTTPAYLPLAYEPQKPTELAGHDAVAYTPVSGSRLGKAPVR